VAPRIWVDVEDLFLYAAGASRPSGTQRLVFELTRALRTSHGQDNVRFLRHGGRDGGFTEVSWTEVEKLFGNLAGSARPRRTGASLAARLRAAFRVVGRYVLDAMPQRLRPAIARFVRLQLQAAFALTTLAREGVSLATSWARTRPMGLRNDSFARDVVAGDTLFAPGAGWIHPRHAEMVAHAKRVHGVRFALLVYDLIPLRRPEWVDRTYAAKFRNWCASILPRCDAVLTISNASAADLRGWTRRAGVIPGADPQVIPIGSGFPATVVWEDAPSRSPHPAATPCSSPQLSRERTTRCCSGCGSAYWKSCRKTRYRRWSLPVSQADCPTT
jgi:hypothetical protein